MARFWSTMTFLSRMHNGSIWNSPSGSTWITSQFITWYIFLKQRNMKNIMSSSASRKCKSICNWPYSFKHFKRPTISWWQLGTTSKLQGTLLFPHSEVNMITNTELFVHPMLSAYQYVVRVQNNLHTMERRLARLICRMTTKCWFLSRGVEKDIVVWEPS